MRRWTTLILALALAAAACGDDAGIAPTAAPSSTSSAAPAASSTSSTESPGITEGTGAPGSTAPSSTSPATTTTTAARRPLPEGAVEAPDFDFVLADGSTFSLRDAQRPIYMVFWAEW